MDNQEIINELLRMKKQYTGAQGCSVTHEKQNAYKASCLSAAIIAVNKQIPKEPTRKFLQDCPTCKKYIWYTDNPPHCIYCGQALKWGE